MTDTAKEMEEVFQIVEKDDSQSQTEKMNTDETSVIGKLSFVDRYLSVWIITVMVLGVICGYYSDDAPERLRSTKILNVSLPVAFGLWFMMWPVLIKVKYEVFGELFRLRETYIQLSFSIAANWVRYSRIFFNNP